MALYDQTRPFAAPQGGAAPLHTRALAAFRAWNDSRKTRGTLARLTSHELADIGLDHGDIDVVADGRRRR
ncbi:DUF1127 domain-containing protein [Histidinibacterium aquaticum]|uniref:DUF1127 domain-containing protein n=1 Tax=Histidinibacterium aquaticum TaxID=2613962 RepID=A0A5J5GQF4_9RHOB|nr:DUF1127 domain-containing protein [Histidinibacterium aquaticum]KAA9010295.1 DUF1127 domain-containing protein [Histidinibacterium aquaticum]